MKLIKKALIFTFVFIMLFTSAYADWVQSGMHIMYYTSDSSYVANKWMFIDDEYYYFDNNGWLKTGWLKLPEGSYYLNPNGIRTYGWANIDGSKYYFAEDGRVSTGLTTIDGSLYNFDSVGRMKTGWATYNNREYYFKKGGTAAIGWYSLDNSDYYFDHSGAMVTGWQVIDGTQYYFDADGRMATKWMDIDGDTYYFTGSGKLTKGWKKISGSYYYFDKNGKMKTGWLKLNKKKYYLGTDGKRVKGKVFIDHVLYVFNSKGVLKESNAKGQTGVNLKSKSRINSDFVAWIKIPGTDINYPVVSSDNTKYYLDHTFEGKKSSLGTLFSPKKYDWELPSKNLMIYGHDVEGSGKKMFKKLLDYKDASFFQEHQYIYLDSIYRPGTYRIFAVFDMTQGDFDPGKSSFASDKEFSSFIKRATRLSLHSSGVKVKTTDTIITLSTCDRFFKRRIGRFIVMAVKVK